MDQPLHSGMAVPRFFINQRKERKEKYKEYKFYKRKIQKMQRKILALCLLRDKSVPTNDRS